MSDSGGGWSDDAEGDSGREAAPGSLSPRRYDDRGPLGAGGMGEVVRCYDAHLQREVARKRIRPELASGPRTERLLREARLTAGLDHPGIVSALDVGTDDSGALFYTMRLVRGRTLAAAAAGLSVAERLRHLLAATRAVAFAHARGVVHRDLKPDNIMVGPFGETQVVDWGLAVRLEEDQVLGAVVGTPGYMSPEQARGEPAGPQADVYALGATLRELVGGEGPPELRAVADHATAPAGERYADASALADDLQAYLDGRVVGAHAYSPWQRLGRALHRYRWPLGVAAALASGAGVAASLATVEIVRERDRAIAAEAVADDVLAAALTRQAVAAVRSGLRADSEVLAEHAYALRPSPRAQGARMAFAATPPPIFDQREVPCDGRYRFGGTAESCLPHDLDDDVSPEAGGTWVSRVGEVVWVPDVGEPRHDAFFHSYATRHGSQAVAWSPTEARWYAPHLAQSLPAPCELLPTAALGPHGAWLACPDGRALYLGDDTVREVVLEGLGPGPRSIGWAADRLVVSDADRLVAFDEEGQMQWVLPLGIGRIRSIRGRPDLDWVWVEGVEPGGRFVDVRHGHGGLRLDARWQGARWADDGLVRWEEGLRHVVQPELAPTVQLDAGIGTAALSPDGSLVALGSGDGQVVLLDSHTAQRRLDIDLGAGVAKWVALSDDALWVSHPSDPMPLRFGLSDGAPLPPPPGRAAGANCKRLLVLDGVGHCALYGRTLLWRLRADEQPRPRPYRLIDTDQGHSVGVVLGEDGEVRRVYAAADDEVVGTFPGSHRLALDHDASHILLATPDGSLTLWREEAQALSWRAPVGLRDVALSADGQLAATGHLDGIARVWSTDTGELLAVLEGIHDAQVATVDFATDVVLTAGWDGRAHRWGLAPLRTPPDPARIEARWQTSLDALVGTASGVAAEGLVGGE